MPMERRGDTMPLAENPAEELEFLQRRIAQLQERIGMTDATAEQAERIVAQEVSKYEQEAPENVIEPSLQMQDEELLSYSQKVAESPDGHMDELLATLTEKGLKNTLSIVEKISSPHVTDDFHRYLVQSLVDGMSVQGLKEGTPMYKALHMTLFEVTLPHIHENEKDFTRLVSSMEQFFEGMLSVESSSKLQKYFTIEVAVSNDHEHIVFYVSVPNTKVGLFEKHMIGAFPRARIEKVQGDYNPFVENGASSASIVRLSRPAVMPLRTYDTFDQDSLNAMLSAFSKLEKTGEGAAIQFVVSPSKDHINKEYQEVLKQVKKGTSLNRAMEGAAMKVAREIVGVFTEGAKGEKDTAPDVDEELVRSITQKISAPIVEANIRIVASAKTKERADEIVHDLESVFHQFSNEPHNSMGFRHVSEKGIKSLLKDYSFRLFSEKYAVRLNLKELTTMIHFPVTELSSSDLKRSALVTAPAPSNMEADGVYLGKNVHQGIDRDVYIASEDRMRHTYVIGQTGTGKTTLLKNMIMQDINNGDGVCYIDPHGSDIEDILNNIPEHRKDDVIYFDPGNVQRPMGLNMLEYDPAHPEQKAFVINEMLSIFNKLFDMKTAGGPMFEQYFRNATALIIDDPTSENTLLDISRVLADARFREKKLATCTNPIVVQFWKEIAGKAGGEASLQNIVPYIVSKFDVFLSNDIMRSIVVQEKSSFNFRDVMDNRKVLLVNLAKGRLGDINAHLIGLILVGKILMAALSRVDQLAQKPPEFYLYIDEFQNVTTDSISAILSEARKYRLGLIVAHQYIAQLDDRIRDAVFGNVGSMAAFRVGTEDAEYLQSQFAPVFSAHDIMRVPNHHAYMKMLVQGYPAQPFNLETIMNPLGDPKMGGIIKELSAQKYGSDKHVVDAMIAEKYARIRAASDVATKPKAVLRRPAASVSSVSPPPSAQTPAPAVADVSHVSPQGDTVSPPAAPTKPVLIEKETPTEKPIEQKTVAEASARTPQDTPTPAAVAHSTPKTTPAKGTPVQTNPFPQTPPEPVVLEPKPAQSEPNKDLSPQEPESESAQKEPEQPAKKVDPYREPFA
jgi:hypothetical protein